MKKKKKKNGCMGAAAAVTAESLQSCPTLCGCMGTEWL